MAYHVRKDSSGKGIEVLSEEEYQSEQIGTAIITAAFGIIAAICYFVSVVCSSMTEQYHSKICGWSDLMNLVYKKNVTVSEVEDIIVLGQDVNTKGSDGNTALILACKENKEDVVLKLLDLGANVNAVNEDGETPLLLVLQHKNTVLAKKIIPNVKDIDRQDNDGYTALHYAVQYDDMACVKLLLHCGANMEIESSRGTTPLMIAAEKGNREHLATLLSAAKRPGHTNIDLSDLAVKAVLGNQLDNLSYLLEEGVSVNTMGPQGHTLLWHAVKLGYPKIAECLLLRGANRTEMRSLVEIAQNNKDVEMVKLLQNVPYPEASALNGNDAHERELSSAAAHNASASNEDAESGNCSGAVNQQDNGDLEIKRNSTPNIRSVTTSADTWSKRHTDISPSALADLKRIQSRLTKLKCKDSDARWSQKRILEILPHILDGQGVDYTAPGMKGNTCLHYACELGSRQLIHWLVENGADVNAVEYGGGNTPLHNAARLASLHTVTYLLEHGANPFVRNNEGLFPSEVVGKDDHDAIVAKLAGN